MSRETTFSSIMAIIGLIINSYLGGWDVGLKILIFCMVFDYITGVLGAIKQRNLDSEVMFWGGVRKSVILMVLTLSVLLDELIGNQAPVFRTLSMYFYISREGLSVVENLGDIGVPIPGFISKVLAQLEDQTKEDKSNGEENKKMTKGIDCATPLTAATAAAFQADGYIFVGRYLVPSGWKALSKKEAEIISAAGLQIISVFETTANRPLSGRVGGLDDGSLALKLAIDRNQPSGSAIYFAVDFDATASQFTIIADYLAAANETTPGYNIGVYGSYAVVEEMNRRGVCSHFWQTYAWSRGKKSELMNIYQYQNDITVNGIGVDLNEAYGDEGWWNTKAIKPFEDEEDESNMPMKLEQWQWDMLYKVLGTAYNSDQLGWNWMQKIVDKTMTATELAFLNTVLDGRIDRNIEV